VHHALRGGGVTLAIAITIAIVLSGPEKFPHRDDLPEIFEEIAHRKSISNSHLLKI
jgi:hypothetical protein